jgi:hypothetical protein
MPNEIIVVQHPAYETKTDYGFRAETAPASDFDSFERLAGALAQVPKSEVDEKREKGR